MGVFSSALSGAIRGAQEMVLQDTLDDFENEINVLNEYVNLLSYGATFYRSLAAGQMVNAACYYGNYKASKDIVKNRYNDDPEKYKEFLDLKKKYVTQFIHEKQKMIKEELEKEGMKKAYATVKEIYYDKMDFYSADELIAEAMIDPEQINQNPAPNYVTSPFGSTAPQEEKKKEKSSYWLFGKK